MKNCLSLLGMCFAIAASFLLLPSTVQAEAIVYESMNYSTGDGALHGKTGDAGLGAWVVSPSGAGKINSPGMGYTDANGNVLASSGNYFHTVTNFNDFARAPIDVSAWSAGSQGGGKLNTKGAEVWFSALMKANSGTHNHFHLDFTDTDNGNASWADGPGYFAIGKTTGNTNWEIRADNDDGDADMQAFSSVAVGNDTFILGRFSTDATTGNTTFDAWFNSLLDTEPGAAGTGDVSITLDANDDGSVPQFNTLGYRHQKWESPNLLDEIRMGESYADVTFYYTDFISATSGDWNTNGTWETAGAPSFDNMVIVNDSDVVTLSGTGQAQTLRITDTGQLQVGGPLTVATTVTVDPGGTLSVTSGGTLNAVEMNTAGATTFDAGSTGNIPTLNATGGNTSIGGGSIGTVNADAGTTSIGGGSVGTLNANAGAVAVSTPTNAITTLNAGGATVSSSGAALATNVNLAGGTMNVTANTAVNNLNVSGGQINAGANSVIIGTELKIGGGTTFTGTGFGAGGTITKDGVGRLELNGGTVGVSAPGAPDVTGINYFQITGDGDARISSADTVTHAIDLGSSGAATVNGVVFATDVNVSAGGRTNAGTRTYGPNNHGGNDPPAVSDGIASVFRDMRFNGPDGGYVELTGLTPDQWYDVRLYDRAWDFNGSIRTFHAAYDLGGDGSLEFTSPKIDQNRGNLTPPGMSGNVSWATSYVYQADSSGKMRVVIDLADDQTGTYHLYGLSNQLVVAGGGGIDMPDTDIVVNAATTLSLETTEPATFGDLVITDLSAALTIDAGPPSIGFDALLFDPTLTPEEGDHTLLVWDADTDLVEFTTPHDFSLFEDAGFDWALNDYLGSNNLTLSLTDAAAALPEPSTFALAALGLLGLLYSGRRRKR